MQKNTASQKLIVFAFDATTNLPKTGDAANLTAYRSLDYGTVTVLTDTSATEMDATNAKGYYLFDLTQAETNADTILFTCKSATSNIVVIGVPATVFTTPANFSTQVISSLGGAQIDYTQVLPTAPVANSVGESLFITDNLVGRISTAQAGAASTITLDASASATDGRYVGYGVYLYGGTGGGIRGVGQERTIVAYNGTTKVATVAQAWGTNPDNTSKFMLYVNPWTNVGMWNGTVNPTPATAGIPDVNVKNMNNVAATAITTIKAVQGLTTADTIVTYTGNTVQTGDSFARIGAAGVGLTAVALTTTQAFNNTGTWTGNIIGTLSTLTTYTGNTVQTGDSFARIGAAGVGLTAVALTTTQAFNNTGTWTGNIVGVLSTLTTYTGNTVQTGDSFAVLPRVVKKNTALAKFPFPMFLTDGYTPYTGLANTITCRRSIDGATYGPLAGGATSANKVEDGSFNADLAAGDLNGTTIMLSFTATGCVPRFATILTQV